MSVYAYLDGFFCRSLVKFIREKRKQETTRRPRIKRIVPRSLRQVVSFDISLRQVFLIPQEQLAQVRPPQMMPFAELALHPF